MNPSNFSSRSLSNLNQQQQNMNKWYEDLEEYERTLEEMTTAKLDQTFQEELQHVNQWFGFLTDAEKTATLYTLLQHSSQTQIRFFIHLLQEMKKPLNRGSERASAIANLNSNRRHSTLNQQEELTNRHSFALGDTQKLGKLFGTMGTDWFSNDDPQQHPLQQPQPRSGISAGSSSLRPKSVIELGGTAMDSSFSNSWLNQRQPGLTHTIERPRSADISSWTLPMATSTKATAGSASSWKPLSNQHDIDLQLWKDPLHKSTTTTESSYKPKPFTASMGGGSSSGHMRKSSFGQHLKTATPSSLESIVNDFGYGSDHSDTSTASSRRYNRQLSTPGYLGSTHPITESHKEDVVDMELIKDVPAWFRSMRLHKYNSIFEHMKWQDIVRLDDEALQEKGVAALGARRKMLKVFDNIKEHCRINRIDY